MKTLVTFIANSALALALAGAALPAAAEDQPPSCNVQNSEATIRIAVPAERSALAEIQGTAGTAYVRVVLNADGVAHDPTIVHSSGSAYLDADALRAALHQVYAPAVHDCAASDGSYMVIVDFPSE